MFTAPAVVVKELEEVAADEDYEGLGHKVPRTKSRVGPAVCLAELRPLPREPDGECGARDTDGHALGHLDYLVLNHLRRRVLGVALVPPRLVRRLRVVAVEYGARHEHRV